MKNITKVFCVISFALILLACDSKEKKNLSEVVQKVCLTSLFVAVSMIN